MQCLPISALILFLAISPISAATLTPQTIAAFDRYIELTEISMNADLGPGRFLHIDGQPDWQAKVRSGHIRIGPGITLDNGKKIDVPDGMIQHWVGTMFIPSTDIQKVKTVLQDYQNYKQFYKPEVIESKLVGQQGNQYDVFLRLYKKQLLTVVLNTNYHVRYVMPEAGRMYVISHSTRIAEVKDADSPDAGEEPLGDDSGFLWRLNSYWRFEQSEGGVYAECQAISLSRDVPGLLGFVVKGFLEKFPQQSMLNTLRGTKAAVMKKR